MISIKMLFGRINYLQLGISYCECGKMYHVKFFTLSSPGNNTEVCKWEKYM